MDSEALDVLKEIRDATRLTSERIDVTNSRLDQTNSRLESLEGRVDFLERRVTKGLDTLGERIDSLSHSQTASELRLSTEVLALADVNRQIRDLLATKLDDHKTVVNHEQRIIALEDRFKNAPQ